MSLTHAWYFPGCAFQKNRQYLCSGDSVQEVRTGVLHALTVKLQWKLLTATIFIFNPEDQEAQLHGSIHPHVWPVMPQAPQLVMLLSGRYLPSEEHVGDNCLSWSNCSTRTPRQARNLHCRPLRQKVPWGSWGWSQCNFRASGRALCQARISGLLLVHFSYLLHCTSKKTKPHSWASVTSSLHSCVLLSLLFSQFYFTSSDAPVLCLAPAQGKTKSRLEKHGQEKNSHTSPANVAQKGCAPLQGCWIPSSNSWYLSFKSCSSLLFSYFLRKIIVTSFFSACNCLLLIASVGITASWHPLEASQSFKPSGSFFAYF